MWPTCGVELGQAIGPRVPRIVVETPRGTIGGERGREGEGGKSRREEDASWEPLGALLGPPGGVAVLAQVWAKAISGGSSLRLRAARASCGAGRAHAAVRRSSGSRRS